MDVSDRAWVKKTLKGLGALQGANCTIQSTQELPTGIKVVFGWTGNDGTAETTEILIPIGAKLNDYKTGSSYKTGDYIVNGGIIYKADKDFTASNIDKDITDGNLEEYIGGNAAPSYTEEVQTASTTWSIQHNLKAQWYELTINIIDSANNIVYADIDVDNCTENLLVVKFNQATSGRIIIKK